MNATFAIIAGAVTLAVCILHIYKPLLSIIAMMYIAVFSQSATIAVIQGRPINVALDTIVIGGLLIAEATRSGRAGFSRDTAFGWAFYTLWAYLAINVCGSSLWGINVAGAVLWVKLVQYVVVLAIFWRYSYSQRDAVRVLDAVIAIGVIGSIQAILQYQSGDYAWMKGMPSFTVPIFRDTDIDQNGLEATSANYNIFGAVLILTLSVNIALIKMRAQSALETGWRWMALAIQLTGLALSSSRSAQLGFAVSFLLTVPRMGRARRVSHALLIAVAIAACILFVRTRYYENIVDVVSNFKAALPYVMQGVPYTSDLGFSGDTYGAVVRIYAYSEAIRVFVHYPVFGVGLERFLMYGNHYPENLFLQILAESGLIGLGLFCVAMYRMYRVSAQRALRTHPVYGLVGPMLAGLLAANMTSSVLFVTKLWGLFVIYMLFVNRIRPQPGLTK